MLQVLMGLMLCSCSSEISDRRNKELTSSSAQAEDDLKVAADVVASNMVSAGSFTVWPSDYQGTKYLQVHFQYRQGGASYPIMMVAVAERSSLVGQGVQFALARTREQFAYPTTDAEYYFGVVESDKVHIYRAKWAGNITSEGQWSAESIGKSGQQDHQRFVGIIRYNALTRGLAIDG